MRPCIEHTIQRGTHDPALNTRPCMEHATLYQAYGIAWSTLPCMEHTALRGANDPARSTRQCFGHTALHRTYDLAWSTRLCIGILSCIDLSVHSVLWVSISFSQSANVVYTTENVLDSFQRTFGHLKGSGPKDSYSCYIFANILSRLLLSWILIYFREFWSIPRRAVTSTRVRYKNNKSAQKRTSK